MNQQLTAAVLTGLDALSFEPERKAPMDPRQGAGHPAKCGTPMSQASTAMCWAGSRQVSADSFMSNATTSIGDGVLNAPSWGRMFSVDEAEELIDEDGLEWVMTMGTGMPAQPHLPEEEVELKSTRAGGRFQTLSCSHHEKLERNYRRPPAPELSVLETQLEEVKAIFRVKRQQSRYLKKLQALDVVDEHGHFKPMEGMFW